MSKSILSLAAMLAVAYGAMAQTSDKPELRHVAQAEKGSHMMNVSDNGLWAVGRTSGDDGTYSSPRLLDVAAGKVIDLFTVSSTHGYACDVTDDGSLVAGSYQDVPSVYYTESGRWRNLPLPPNSSFNDGQVSSITPDGKFAVGYAYTAVQSGGEVAGYVEIPLAWDFTSGKAQLITLPNMPDFDLNGDPASQVRLLKVSADGRYIFGQVDFSYPMTCWCFLYDMDTKTWKPLGIDYDGEKLIVNQNTKLVEDMYFSPNGKYMAVNIYSDEGGSIGLYDPATGEITEIPDSSGKILCDIDNNGVIYASAPSTPIRDWSFYVDGYWFDWKLALKQLWGIDWQNDFTKDDMGLSGTYVGTSADGLRLFSADYSGSPGGSYLVTLPQPLASYSKQLDPLSNYMIFPGEGSSFSSVRNITVYFDRDIEVVGDRSSVVLLDSEGQEVKTSMSIALEAGQTRNMLITFRNATLEAGETYTVVIPAGTVQVKGDPNRKNKEMRVSYVGRADVPVKPVKISPESGTAMPSLSMSSNPITIEFDAVLSVLDGASIGLYRMTSDNEQEYLYALSSNVSGSIMTVYPVAEQELAKDVTYKVIISPNSVGDLAGNNGNEQIEITYVGTYENTPNYVDGVLFSENFDNFGVNNMLLYDGDQNTPQSLMADWGFNAQYPWWIARDSDQSTEQSAVSHSMYTPAGQSDDWMVTPRIYVPDETCVLTFDSQSYKFNKEDYLKVYILTTDDIYTAPITKNFIDRIKSEGELVYNEKQTPGATEELLTGEWTENKVDLKDYAGKNIYIAFANDNNDQSAVFVDNILVQRDLEFTIAVDVPDYVENKESVPVKVSLNVLGDQTYNTISFRLADADDNTIVEETKTDLNLKKDDVYTYTFSKELPLEKGRINSYTVEAKVGEQSVSLPATIKNLRFTPKRTVVIEEGTGTQCGFCPLGHRALELMEEIYGESVIPVAVHSYTSGSIFLNDWTAQYGQFLGFQAYPMATLNREVTASPMYSDGINYSMNDPEGDSTWFDYVEKMLGQLTDAEIGIDRSVIDPEQGMIQLDVNMKYAYDAENTNLRVHTVVMENNLPGVQTNNVASNTSSILGEWGAGGIYGKPTTPYVFSHVARGMNGNIFTGVSGVFPRKIDSAEEYKKTYEFAIPSYLSNHSNAEVVVMLIDGNSGKIINAAKSPLLIGTVGVDNIFDSEESTTGDVYSVTGVKVLQNATIEDVNRLDKGIYIFNGKKIMVR